MLEGCTIRCFPASLLLSSSEQDLGVVLLRQGPDAQTAGLCLQVTGHVSSAVPGWPLDLEQACYPSGLATW